jgi:hypothetical protein
MGIISFIQSIFSGKGEKEGDICLTVNPKIFQTCAYCGIPAIFRIKEPDSSFTYVCQGHKDSLYPDILVTGVET